MTHSKHTAYCSEYWYGVGSTVRVSDIVYKTGGGPKTSSQINYRQVRLLAPLKPLLERIPNQFDSLISYIIQDEGIHIKYVLM